MPSSLGNAPSSGIGKGSKTALINANVYTPSPQKYNIEGSQSMRKSGVKFGLGRDVIIKIDRKLSIMAYSTNPRLLNLDTTIPEIPFQKEVDLQYILNYLYHHLQIQKILDQLTTTQSMH